MKKMNVLVLAGGWSRERDISIKSGFAVFNALNKKKYNMKFFDPASDISSLIRESVGIDIVFNLLHGRLGEDGSIQGLLNILRVPYVGSDVLASAVALHKGISKDIYRAAGLLVPRAVRLARGVEWSYEGISAELGLPVVVKPASEGSSIGISICTDKDALSRGIAGAFECERDIIIEEFIEGREITCCVMGNDVQETLPLIEIIPQNGNIFDYEAKYTPGATIERCPAELDEPLAGKASSCGARAHRALGCSVWSRTDMIVKGDCIYVLETNTIPGMTENSLFPLAARAAGMSFPGLLDSLIGLSLEKHINPPDRLSSKTRQGAFTYPL